MRFLQLILSNWVFLVVLFFIVSRLIKGWKQSGTGPVRKDRPGTGMPSFGGNIPARPERRVEPVGETKPNKTGTKPAEFSPRSMETAFERMEAERVMKPSAASPFQSISRDPKRTAMASSDEDRPDPPIGPSIKPQDAAQGVVWAEILGPPRAKRPYRRF